MDEQTRAEVAHLQESLYGWAFGDVKRTAQKAEAPIGAFILGAHFIDTLAGLARTKGDGRAAWDEFVPRYLPRYTGHVYLLYKGFRGATSHHYSAEGIRFVQGESNAPRHWTEEEGERVLHLETFIKDLEAGWEKFFADLEDEDFRTRVVDRAREKPPLGIRGGGPVSVGDVIRVAGSHPTHFGPRPGTAVTSASAASASFWPTTVELAEATPFRFEPPPTPPEKRAIPKGKPKRQRKSKG
jgi:hypothetical protein